MTQLAEIETATHYRLETDYEKSPRIVVLEKDDELAYVILLEDCQPLGWKGDTSWVEPDDVKRL